MYVCNQQLPRETFPRMPRIPIFRLGGAPDKPALPNLAASTPFFSLEGISVGVDNLRHDVLLSPRFVELARAQVARLIARHGDLEDLIGGDTPTASQAPSWIRSEKHTSEIQSPYVNSYAVLL